MWYHLCRLSKKVKQKTTLVGSLQRKLRVNQCLPVFAVFARVKFAQVLRGCCQVLEGHNFVE